MIRLPEGATCATCPWLADDWVEGSIMGAKRCGLRLPAQFPTMNHRDRNPRIDYPERNGCSLHPRAIDWAVIQGDRLARPPEPEPAPEPPGEPPPRRRAIRSE